MVTHAPFKVFGTQVFPPRSSLNVYFLVKSKSDSSRSGNEPWDWRFSTSGDGAEQGGGKWTSCPVHLNGKLWLIGINNVSIDAHGSQARPTFNAPLWNLLGWTCSHICPALQHEATSTLTLTERRGCIGLCVLRLPYPVRVLKTWRTDEGSLEMWWGWWNIDCRLSQEGAASVCFLSVHGPYSLLMLIRSL